MPQARGFGFVTSIYVDVDHAGDTITRRSRTGLLIYGNSALVSALDVQEAELN